MELVYQSRQTEISLANFIEENKKIIQEMKEDAKEADIRMNKIIQEMKEDTEGI